VVGPDSTQEDMFNEVEHVAVSVVDGFRACIFAYGITGGGKTYTMQGTPTGSQPGAVARPCVQQRGMASFYP
jgi:hypothetical protein